jgi:hypothetical protein
MANRLTPQLCEAIRDRKSAVDGMATEKRNPSGYVDVRLLHDLGQRVQDDDATIAELKADYAKLAHKPFSEASCSK